LFPVPFQNTTEVKKMVLITGSSSMVVPDDPLEELYPKLRKLAKQVADDIVPKRLSKRGNQNARVLAEEVLRNTLHGTGVVIEIDSYRDGTLKLTTLNQKGPSRLKSQYSEDVEIPYQGMFLIVRIAGIQNFRIEENGNTFITITRFDPEAIMAAC
jgi:hypothetical protein